MRIKVAFPGTPPFALEAARAFHEADMLAGFVTTYHYRPEAPLDSSIRIQSTAPRSKLAAIYKRADILAFPTLANGFGMVVTEAFAQGLSVMTRDRAGAIDLVRHKHNGLVVTPASAEAIEWCLTHRTELTAMRKGARATAASWQWLDYRMALSQGNGACLTSLNASA